LILAKSKLHYKVLAYPYLVDTKMHAHGVYIRTTFKCHVATRL